MKETWNLGWPMGRDEGWKKQAVLLRSEVSLESGVFSVGIVSHYHGHLLFSSTSHALKWSLLKGKAYKCRTWKLTENALIYSRLLIVYDGWSYLLGNGCFRASYFPLTIHPSCSFRPFFFFCLATCLVCKILVPGKGMEPWAHSSESMEP